MFTGTRWTTQLNISQHVPIWKWINLLCVSSVQSVRVFFSYLNLYATEWGRNVIGLLVLDLMVNEGWCCGSSSKRPRLLMKFQPRLCRNTFDFDDFGKLSDLIWLLVGWAFILIISRNSNGDENWGCQIVWAGAPKPKWECTAHSTVGGGRRHWIKNTIRLCAAFRVWFYTKFHFTKPTAIPRMFANHYRSP